MIEWRTDYRLGIPEIDGEHIILWGLLNQIQINAAAKRTTECIDDVLHALVAYARFHFAHEEQLMSEAGYAEMDAHRTQHQSFLEIVAEMQASNSHDTAMANRIGTFIQGWLVDHIFTSDARFALAAQAAR